MATSLILKTMRESYRAQRGVSQGAEITLTSRSGGFEANFECATRCSEVLGARNLRDIGTSVEPIPQFKIPLADMQSTCKKLAEAHSVALVDFSNDEDGSRFVMVWKIDSRPDKFSFPIGVELTLPEDPNQGSLHLEDY